MAKLTAPLFSFTASGKIADALVYFGWKGLNVVRQYVVPSNPQTDAQTTQRDYLKDAVAMVHTAQARAGEPLDEVDQIANSTLATVKGIVMTWFNQIVKLWCDVKVATKSPIVYSDGTTSHKAATGARMIVYLNEETGSDLDAGKFYLGTSKTNLFKSSSAVISLGASAYLDAGGAFTGLTVGRKYYWQFRPDSGVDCEGADSGIYSFVAE